MNQSREKPTDWLTSLRVPRRPGPLRHHRGDERRGRDFETTHPLFHPPMTSQISMSEINLLARENLPFASFVHLFRLSGFARPPPQHCRSGGGIQRWCLAVQRRVQSRSPDLDPWRRDAARNRRAGCSQRGAELSFQGSGLSACSCHDAVLPRTLRQSHISLENMGKQN